MIKEALIGQGVVVHTRLRTACRGVCQDARLEDIGNRLGFDSEPYRICSETIEWLKRLERKN